MGTAHVPELRRAYGFDDVAIAPGEFTVNPDQTSIAFSVDGIDLTAPVLASAVDAVVSPSFAKEMDRLGGVAVMNLEGIQTRYEDPEEAMSEIIEAPRDEVIETLQRVYASPVREDLIGARIEEMKSGGARCAVSVTPASTKRLAPAAVEAGADVLVVQSTGTTARHVSKSARGLVFPELLETIDVPVIVGNCVGYDAALELMETGIHAVLVGVGPGAICTTREVTGVGVPQVTSTLDCAAARDEHYRRSGRYVPIITDGGIRTGGDLCKAFASGADAVMLGTPFAQASEAPGRGYNWGMASHHSALPRGTRLDVGVSGTLEQILFGPTSKTDGTQNMLGALQVCMGMVGATTIREMHAAEVIVAPAMRTEGKHYQLGLN